jgi:hypothetical protein
LAAAVLIRVSIAKIILTVITVSITVATVTTAITKVMSVGSYATIKWKTEDIIELLRTAGSILPLPLRYKMETLCLYYQDIYYQDIWPIESKRKITLSIYHR